MTAGKKMQLAKWRRERIHNLIRRPKRNKKGERMPSNHKGRQRNDEEMEW